MGLGTSDLLSGLLKDVSRSFYLTLRVLPEGVRPQIGLAYLLARASDTIADTDALPKTDRLAALAAVQERICHGKISPLSLETLAGRQSSASERLLLQRLEEAFSALERLEITDRQWVREVLGTIISGQALDLERFAGATVDHIIPLESDAQLEDYTYRVAGCVGEFWTRMCRAHAFPRRQLDDAFLLKNGIRFGKGLQLVNVLRDLPSDLRLGRCYLPRASLQGAGLSPADLLQPGNEARLRPVYLRYVQQAEDHLHAGWEYTNHLPWGNIRIRLACAWPILIGMATLAKLGNGPVLDPKLRIKLSRHEVRQVLFRSIALYPLPVLWRRLLAQCGSTRRKPLLDQASLAK